MNQFLLFIFFSRTLWKQEQNSAGSWRQIGDLEIKIGQESTIQWYVYVLYKISIHMPLLTIGSLSSHYKNRAPKQISTLSDRIHPYNINQHLHLTPK